MNLDFLKELLDWVVANQSYLFLALSGVLYFFFERKSFVEIVKSAFLSAEKAARRGILEGGVEKMQSAVWEIVESLPMQVKAVLRVVASLRRQTLEELTQELAQAIYDKAVEPLNQSVLH